MLGLMAFRSLTRRPGRRALAMAAVALGTAVVLALVAVASDVGDRMARELRAGGANIVLLPTGRAELAALPGGTLSVPLPGPLLQEGSVPAILGTFWANNIVSVSPTLETVARVARDGAPTAELLLVGTHFDTQLTAKREDAPMGLLNIAPYAAVEGQAPLDIVGEGSVARPVEALIGASLAARIGVAPPAHLMLKVAGPGGAANDWSLEVTGTISTGGPEDDRLFAPLAAVQQASGQPGLVSKVLVSALLAPEDRLYARAAKNLESLSPHEYEIYMCRAYPLLVARDLAGAVAGSEGQPLLKTADAEGRLVEGMRWITIFVAAAVIGSTVLAVLAALATSIVERRREVGLLKAMGASPAQVLTPFLLEAGVTSLVGGAAGFALGLVLAWTIGMAVFGRPVILPTLLAVPAIVIAIALTSLGAFLPIRLVLRIDAATVLKGN